MMVETDRSRDRIPATWLLGATLLGCMIVIGGLGLGVDVAEGHPSAAQTTGQTPTQTTGQGADRPDWKPGDTCVSSSCHTDLRGQHMHGPVALRACDPCHAVQNERHEFVPTFTGRDLCAQCHESFFDFDADPVIHGPVASGQCTACHDPHGGKAPIFTLRKKVGDGLCFDCHERADLIGDGKPHGPLALGQDCSICHDPHSSKHPKLQRKAGVQLCSTCHDEIRRLDVPGTQWHAPVEENCANCHDPHSSTLPKHLHASLPGLCLSCHQDQAQELAEGRIHEALRTPDRCADCHKSPPKNANAEECPLVGPAGEPGNCLECHDPHGSGHGKLLSKPLMETCLACHDQPIEVAGRPTIPSVKEQIEGKAHVHGPLEQGNCVACHQPHASEHWRLLNREFPERFYAPFEEDRYGLCFQCHDDALVTERETAQATNFRHGTRNLHALHVNREKKGRSCRACHEVHASDLPFQLRKTTPFGTWEMPIGWERTAEGGKCAPGCHEPVYYHRNGEEQP